MQFKTTSHLNGNRLMYKSSGRIVDGSKFNIVHITCPHAWLSISHLLESQQRNYTVCYIKKVHNTLCGSVCITTHVESNIALVLCAPSQIMECDVAADGDEFSVDDDTQVLHWILSVCQLNCDVDSKWIIL